jgi:hypothetical protein
MLVVGATGWLGGNFVDALLEAPFSFSFAFSFASLPFLSAFYPPIPKVIMYLLAPIRVNLGPEEAPQNRRLGLPRSCNRCRRCSIPSRPPKCHERH